MSSEYPLPEGVEADFAVIVTDDSCEPYIRRGGAALIKSGLPARDGDVGFFFDGTEAVIRQYCEDWAGNAYLFALNRARRGLDRMYPAAEAKPVCCFGLVQGLGRVPLPER